MQCIATLHCIALQRCNDATTNPSQPAQTLIDSCAAGSITHLGRLWPPHRRTCFSLPPPERISASRPPLAARVPTSPHPRPPGHPCPVPFGRLRPTRFPKGLLRVSRPCLPAG